MITLRYIELLIGWLSFFLAYLAVVTVAGSSRAWVASKMGDQTADDLGFTSLNPLVHVDFLGMLFLVIFSFGWGRNVPINPFNITEPNRGLKLFLAYMSNTFAYLIAALIGIIFLTVFFGAHMFEVAYNMLACFNMNHLYLVETCPTLSSLGITIAFIIISAVYLSVLLAVLSLILNGCVLGTLLLTEHLPEYAVYNQYVTFFVPIILIIVFSEYLRLLAIYGIFYAGLGIAQLLHLI